VYKRQLFDLGQEFDDVYDQIRIQTGITGDALAELQDSFRNVARQVPNDFADIGIAIQDLNTRLGVSGEPLEDLALQLLTVTRLMGGDIQSNVRVATRLFGDFGVAAEDQADTLDLLFRASQASGQSFDTLADQTVNVGADVRALGFSLEETVAMLALFERTGVNTENVMSGLRQAVARFAQRGEDIPTAFRTAIETIRDTQDAAEASAIAFELVGSRYQANFVDTVRGGKFDIDELIASLNASSETITGAAEDTDGFRESWDRFKNYLKLTLEPVATEVFANMEGLVGELVPAVDRVKAAFEEDGLEGALAQVAEEWDRIYEENIKPLWDQFLLFLDETVKPLAIAIAKEIGSAMWEGLKTAFTDGLKRGLLGDGERESLLSEADRLRLELAGGDLERPPGADGATNAPAGGRDGGIPPLPPPPRPSPSSGPGGSGAPGRGAFTVPRIAPTPGMVVPFAHGGLVMSPTLGLVGEAGPELVVPLDRAPQLGGTTVNVTVTSADPEAVVDAIRRYTRANGPLAQVVRV